MKNKILKKSIQTAFKTCPIDCLLMALIQLIIVCLPISGLYILNSLVASLVKKSVLNIFISVIGYCLVIWLQKALQDWYNHYFLTYFILLKFEKKIKEEFFRMCLLMKLDDYNDAEFVNHSLRAKNASVNILRLYQAIVEFVCTFVSVFAMGLVVSNINNKLIVIFLIMCITEIVDNIFILYQNKKFLYENTQLEKEEGEISDLLLKAKSLKEIILFNSVQFVLAKWKDVTNELLKNEKNKAKKIFVFSLCMKLIYCVGMVCLYLLLFRVFLLGEIGMGEFSVSISAFVMIRGVFSGLFEEVANVSQFAIMVQPFFDYLDNVKKYDRNKIVTKTAKLGNIVLKGVSYRYNNVDKNSLNKIDLMLEEGKKYVIVGENGSGKTTLMRVIMGLYEPTDGEITCGGINLKDWDENILFSNFSDVSQDYNIYAISVIDNIGFSGVRENFDVTNALAEMDLQTLQNSKDCIIGKEFGGIQISGGQSQKIAILRAENKAGKVFFFDEPTSAIDPLQEKKIFDRICCVAKGKTTVIVSHRLALCKLADSVIVMSQGNVVEMGTHNELMQKKGIYESLYNEQAQLYNIS